MVPILAPVHDHTGSKLLEDAVIEPIESLQSTYVNAQSTGSQHAVDRQSLASQCTISAQQSAVNMQSLYRQYTVSRHTSLGIARRRCLGASQVNCRCIVLNHISYTAVDVTHDGYVIFHCVHSMPCITSLCDKPIYRPQEARDHRLHNVHVLTIC